MDLAIVALVDDHATPNPVMFVGPPIGPALGRNRAVSAYRPGQHEFAQARHPDRVEQIGGQAPAQGPAPFDFGVCGLGLFSLVE